MKFVEACEAIHQAATRHLQSRYSLYMDDDYRPQVVIDDSKKSKEIDDIYDNSLRDIFWSLSYEDQIKIALAYDKGVFNTLLDENQKMAVELIR